MKKLTDYDKEEKESIENFLESKANLLGFDRWEGTSGCNPLERFGICSSCKHMQYARTQFTIRKAFCYNLEIILSEQAPITECTNYNKKGEMTLQMMMEIAHIIEIPKNRLGFE